MHVYICLCVVPVGGVVVDIQEFLYPLCNAYFTCMKLSLTGRALKCLLCCGPLAVVAFFSVSCFPLICVCQQSFFCTIYFTLFLLCGTLSATVCDVKPRDIFLIHDELDLKLGLCHIKEGGSARYTHMYTLVHTPYYSYDLRISCQHTRM